MQDEKLLSIPEDLQHLVNCIQRYLCSHTVFNSSKKVLIETEIKVLEKELDFATLQKKVNEPELRKNLKEEE